MKKISLFFVAICFCTVGHAQLDFAKLSSDQLLAKGQASYKQGDYASASAYLFSYYQKNYDVLKQNSSWLTTCVIHADKTSRDYKTQFYQLQNQIRNQNRANGAAVAESGLGDSGPPLVIPAKPTAYTLVLSGNENITFTLEANKAMGLLEVQIAGFGKAPSGYDANNMMENGLAAWLDRPIYTNEPTMIILPIQNEDFTITTVSGQIEYGGCLWILNWLKVPGRKFNFNVYNDGQGHFMVTDPPNMHKVLKVKAAAKPKKD